MAFGFVIFIIFYGPSSHEENTMKWKDGSGDG